MWYIVNIHDIDFLGEVIQVAHKRVFISGLVQGVYYRDYTRREAEKLGIRGWVRNLPDGRVEAVFAGLDEAVEQMITWCRRGSPRARVTGVEVRDEPGEANYTGFQITG